MSFPCIGCDREQVEVRHTYGPVCRDRLKRGIPLDVEDFITFRESQRMNGAHRLRPWRGAMNFGGRRAAR